MGLWELYAPVTSASDSEDPDAETHFESAHKEVQLEGAIPKPMKSNRDEKPLSSRERHATRIDVATEMASCT